MMLKTIKQVGVNRNIRKSHIRGITQTSNVYKVDVCQLGYTPRGTQFGEWVKIHSN